MIVKVTLPNLSGRGEIMFQVFPGGVSRGLIIFPQFEHLNFDASSLGFRTFLGLGSRVSGSSNVSSISSSIKRASITSKLYQGNRVLSEMFECLTGFAISHKQAA